MTPTLAAAALLQASTILCPTGYAIARSTPVSPLPPSQTDPLTPGEHLVAVSHGQLYIDGNPYPARSNP